jgi:hypothetical protein
MIAICIAAGGAGICLTQNKTDVRMMAHSSKTE